MRKRIVETEEHKTIAAILRDKICSDWRKFTVAVDGCTGVGKSELGRYLAWKLDMPCIETDMYRIEPGVTYPRYRINELKTVIKSRHELNQPVILEGNFLLRTMEQISIEPDFLIYVKNKRADCGYTSRESWLGYLADYKPERRAHFIFLTDSFVNVDRDEK
jgi:hypothetical protein